MSLSLEGSVWIVIVLALVGANVPFLSHRRLGIFKLKKKKTLLNHFFELIILFFLIGFFSLLLEKNIGSIYPQRWEFYALSAALFLTLAFPGFVYRYLRKN